jgi:DNA-binding beta-propeller fold protein YncE
VIGKGRFPVDKNIARGLVAVAAVAALSAAGAGGTGAPVAAAAAAAAQTARVHSGGTSHGPAGPGAQLWIARYNGPHNSEDGVSSMAVSPDGKTVFVTGTSEKALAGDGPGDFATIAYRAATGARLWVARYNGPGDSFDQATSLAVSLDGETVFVTGSSNTSQGGPSDYATVAYDAATGAQLWVSRGSGPGSRIGGATSVAVSPDGATVFVTGYSNRPAGDRGDDYATIAYRAATGARLWVARYNGPGTSSEDAAFSVAVSPDGSGVFVTGSSNSDYATVAYLAATGTQLWATRYNGPSDPRDGAGGISVAVSPDGSKVFVTGASSKPNSVTGYATIGYNAATGSQLWATRYNAPGNGMSRPSSLAVSPDGSKVFVTGASNGDYGTVGYNAATGGQLWAIRYNGPGNLDDFATAVAVSPDGSQVFVTGLSTGATRHYDFATIAYRAGTGTQLWATRDNRAGGSRAMAVSPDGSRVFVAGSSVGATTHADYTTIAYHS